MKKYTIGIDYGTLSARCLLIDATSGEEVAEEIFEYPHGVIEQSFKGQRIPDSYALQDPEDYLRALKTTVRAVMRAAGVNAKDVVGIGIDFTACTLLPVTDTFRPLSTLHEFCDDPHAYAKLWKHHGAEAEADRITHIARKRGEEWLGVYGGTVSCEWALPKIYETLKCSPRVYDAAAHFIEAGDWITYMLTGENVRSLAFAGFKGLYTDKGYPSREFLEAVDVRLGDLVGTKVCENVIGPDRIAGRVDERGYELCGLEVGTAVSVPIIDAHAAMPALGICGSGELMLILGTSACHISNSLIGKSIPGICGYVSGGVIPGIYTYEAGQAAVGDIFDWFVKNCVPATYENEAKERGIGIHKLLREKASALEVGESGLVALDWWNGNRSILVDPSLRGMITGFTLKTRPEHIYRALIEATAFGLRVICEQYGECGIDISDIVAAGGIALKDEMMMQIYADVLDREISVSDAKQAAAYGSAIYAAVAAGLYPSLNDATAALAKPRTKRYVPIRENVTRYDELYLRYRELHDYFATHK